MQVKCPHCDKPFDIVSNEELLELHITPNVRARALEKGLFPRPWAQFGNRHLWLRDEVLDYVTEQVLRETEHVVDPMLERIMRLPPEQQQAARRLLRERLEVVDGEGEPRRSKTRNRG